MDDSYKTIEEIAEGYITERKSKFISYAIPVETEDEVKEIIEEYRKKYYNAFNRKFFISSNNLHNYFTCKK